MLGNIRTRTDWRRMAEITHQASAHPQTPNPQPEHFGDVMLDEAIVDGLSIAVRGSL